MPQLDQAQQKALDVVAEAEKLLPAWFVPRMMTDSWPFALSLSSGMIVGISRIDRIRQAPNGEIWIDAQMLDVGDYPVKVFCAPTDRLQISLNARHIQAAFEIGTS